MGYKSVVMLPSFDRGGSIKEGHFGLENNNFTLDGNHYLQ
jgi:hypothetical protein